MAIQTINIGTTANDGTGDDPRTAGGKINDNFTNSTHAASRDVGTAAGEVSVNYGVGETPVFTGDADTIIDQKTLYARTDQGATNTPVSNNGYFCTTPSSVSGYFLQDYTVGFGALSGERFLRVFSAAGGGFTGWFKQLSTRNTTVDGSGFIKEASPIVKLYSDKIEANDYKEIENCTFERVDTGHYIIKGAPLLSRDGWYIETLKDRNNNIYFTLDYEELEDGLHIKTYTPDYSTGRATNGEPVDINEGRFVTLRFEEDKAEE